MKNNVVLFVFVGGGHGGGAKATFDGGGEGSFLEGFIRCLGSCLESCCYCTNTPAAPFVGSSINCTHAFLERFPTKKRGQAL